MKANHSAFPTISERGLAKCEEGLSKRELIAAMAMQSVVASLAKIYDEPVIPYAARLSVQMADALIAELSK